MPLKNKTFFVALTLALWSAVSFAQTYPPPQRVAADLHKLLDRPKVAFDASFTITKTDSVIIEHGYFFSEKKEKVPTLIYKPVSGRPSFPAVIFLHGTGGSKDDKYITAMLYQLSKRGIIGVAIDARYHGERIPGGAHRSQEYVGAITAAWENKDPNHQTHPFYFDTVYDLWRLVDYLITRPDIQANRIGMAGISMGGIETWLAASADKRIKVIVPDIAVQSFKWSLDNGRWQGRAGTIREAHQQAAKDLGDTAINARNIRALWDKLIPGIIGEFDCPSMLRLCAPRPLLILNTEKDPNNPLPGAKIAYRSAVEIYTSQNAAEKIKMDIAPNAGHAVIPEQMKMLIDWFGKWL